MNPTPHTPGPWRAYNASNGRIFKRWRIGRFGARTVAELCENNSPEIEAANAALISAAPELLTALRELADAADRVNCSLTVRDLHGAIASLASPLFAARLAISKASQP